jgi:hypothetical protein
MTILPSLRRCERRSQRLRRFSWPKLLRRGGVSGGAIVLQRHDPRLATGNTKPRGFVAIGSLAWRTLNGEALKG